MKLGKVDFAFGVAGLIGGTMCIKLAQEEEDRRMRAAYLFSAIGGFTGGIGCLLFSVYGRGEDIGYGGGGGPHDDGPVLDPDPGGEAVELVEALEVDETLHTGVAPTEAEEDERQYADLLSRRS
jgi:hypothetical protein